MLIASVWNLSEAIAQALSKSDKTFAKMCIRDRKNNERMVIDFYADWCIPCKELDALTFSDQRVLNEFERFTVYKVDMTKNNETNEQLRKRFNVIGMPTVLIIDSKGAEIKRLTGFVNAD